MPVAGAAFDGANVPDRLFGPTRLVEDIERIHCFVQLGQQRMVAVEVTVDRRVVLALAEYPGIVHDLHHDEPEAARYGTIEEPLGSSVLTASDSLNADGDKERTHEQ